MSIIDDKIKFLPSDPGVYVMLDKSGQIIYVGKAKNLKNRVRQYFQNGIKPEKVAAMVRSVADFYYIIAPSEIDALSLENNLIKKHKPRYNILLKDDKTYPYIKIDLKEPFPYAKITRKVKADGAKYFGPYMGGISVSGTIEVVNVAFGLRPCEKKLGKTLIKPCLDYQLARCSAPCTGTVDEKDYGERVKKAIEFLNGDTTYAEKILTQKMNAASQKEEFEIALKYRDLIISLDKLKIKRLTALNKIVDVDVVAYCENGVFSAVSLLIVRNGRTLGEKNFSFETGAQTQSEALSEFIMRYYKQGVEIPPEIIVEREISDSDTLAEFLKNEYNKHTRIVSPKKGIKKRLVDMTKANAAEYLTVSVNKIKHKNDMTIKACESLQKVLSLKNYPKRMECYDISNISGVDKVGSMVVFDEGEPDKASYRRFKIKSFEGADDFRSLKEMLSRRLERLKTDPDKFPKPDLIVIDGGKGQLSSVKEIFDQFGVEDIDLISLAKREEEIFTVFSQQPIVLGKSDYRLRMLQRIRDEAHRFAITYHRSLRDKRTMFSVLEKAEGIGKVKIKAILERFKDVGALSLATEEEIKEVEGIGDATAKAVIDVLTKEGLR